ncbi:MAG TPA: helix-turn-helix transcriptional regulator [Afipia sp.]
MSTAIETSERTDGPSLIAFWGSNEPTSGFRLGSFEYDWHHHVRGQLFCIDSGLAHIQTSKRSWLLSPHTVGWIPPGMVHKAGLNSVLSGWGVMLTPTASDGLPSEPCVMGVSELLRALVRRAATWHHLECLSSEQERVVEVLHDEIRHARREPLHLPLPLDQRLLRITRFLSEHPGENRSLTSLAREAGLSERAARRLFIAQTGMNFTQWRQLVRLVMSLDKLARGETVASVADALGYATPSSFIAVFRGVFGLPPARYFSSQHSAQARSASCTQNTSPSDSSVSSQNNGRFG